MNLKSLYRKLVYNNQRNMCKLPCKKIKAYFGVMEKDQEGSSKQNQSHVRIYVKSTVQYTETVIDYPLNSMLAGIWYFYNLTFLRLQSQNHILKTEALIMPFNWA